MVIGYSIGYSTSCRCNARRRVVSALQKCSAFPQSSDRPANTDVASYVSSLSRWSHTSRTSVRNPSSQNCYIACAVVTELLNDPPFLRLRMHEQRLIYTARSRRSGSQRSHRATGRPVFLQAPSRGATCDFTPRTFFWSSCPCISSVSLHVLSYGIPIALKHLLL